MTLLFLASHQSKFEDERERERERDKGVETQRKTEIKRRIQREST